MGCPGARRLALYIQMNKAQTAWSRPTIIMEQGAQNMLKRIIEQRKIE